jgi:hypothetical protein
MQGSEEVRMMKNKIPVYVAIFAAAIMTGVFLYSGMGTALRSFKPDIRGVITEITFDGNTGNILVEETADTGLQFDKASVYLTNDTVYYKDGKKMSKSPELLVKGMNLEVQITGTVRESYPVQVDARIVNILTSGK